MPKSGKPSGPTVDYSIIKDPHFYKTPMNPEILEAQLAIKKALQELKAGASFTPPVHHAELK